MSGGIQINHTGNIKVVLDCTTQAAASGYQQLFLPYVNDVAAGTENAFAVLMDAARVCTLQQVTDAFFEVGGQYRRNV